MNGVLLRKLYGGKADTEFCYQKPWTSRSQLEAGRAFPRAFRRMALQIP